MVEILFDIVPGAKLGNTKIYSSSRSISNGFMDILLELEAIYIFSRNAVEPLSELDRSVLLIADGIMTNCELGSLNKFGANGNHSRDPNANFCHSGAPRWMEEGKGGRIELERTSLVYARVFHSTGIYLHTDGHMRNFPVPGFNGPYSIVALYLFAFPVSIQIQLYKII